MRSVGEPPLVGVTVAVTRPSQRADSLVHGLDALGATTLVLPLIRIEALEDSTDLTAALDCVDRYDWVVLTSANGVAAVGVDGARALGKVRVAAVGPATAAALRDAQIEPAYVPARYAAEEIAAGLEPLRDLRILLLQADLADAGLAEILRSRGAAVDAVTAYRTVDVERAPAELEELRAADAVVLASGSAARSLASQGGAGAALVVCIGPKTADIAREVGLPVGLLAREATGEGIIQALVAHFQEI